ncbi:hypothetical protein ANCDUO_00613 [Ancylostoma duodenale]|uniref:Helitron helicase-like domain-containing protein n=1 Tax=Ancylostoma duodenale TaxID=51022 RepID=A0A0C2H5C5_9BILA|nr:hypothetical protein ANCDUO_00613 [Ancylostoma duodenale]
MPTLKLSRTVLISPEHIKGFDSTIAEGSWIILAETPPMNHPDSVLFCRLRFKEGLVLCTSPIKRKLEALREYLLKKDVLGRVVANVALLKWQKRGLPHCHMLLIMSAEAKPRNVERVVAIQNSLPDPQENSLRHSSRKRDGGHRRRCARDPKLPVWSTEDVQKGSRKTSERQPI